MASAFTSLSSTLSSFSKNSFLSSADLNTDDMLDILDIVMFVNIILSN